MITKKELQSRIQLSADEALLFFKQLVQAAIVSAYRLDGFIRPLDQDGLEEDEYTWLKMTLTKDGIETDYDFKRNQDVRSEVEKYVLLYSRVVSWLKALNERQLIESSWFIEDFLKYGESVQHARNYLVHLDEYLVSGTGHYPEGFQATGGVAYADPTSTVRIENSIISGMKIEKQYWVGQHFEFYTSKRNLTDFYFSCFVDGFEPQRP